MGVPAEAGRAEEIRMDMEEYASYISACAQSVKEKS